MKKKKTEPDYVSQALKLIESSVYYDKADPRTINIPTDSLESANDLIRKYVFTVGRKEKLLPRDMKIEDVTTEHMCDVLAKLIFPDGSHNLALGSMKSYLVPFLGDVISGNNNTNKEDKGGNDE